MPPHPRAHAPSHSTVIPRRALECFALSRLKQGFDSPLEHVVDRLEDAGRARSLARSVRSHASNSVSSGALLSCRIRRRSLALMPLMSRSISKS